MGDQQSVRRQALAIDVAVALLSLLAALAMAEIIYSVFKITRVSLVFVAAVTVTASIRGSRAGLVAALAGVLFYRIFVELRVGERTGFTEDVLNVLIFLVVALLTGALAGRVHDEAAISRIRAERMESLFRASRKMSEEDEDTFWPVLAETVAHMSRGPGLVLDEAGELKACADESGGAGETEALDLGRSILRSPEKSVERTEAWNARLLVSQGSPAGVLIWRTDEQDSEVQGTVALLAELASASIERARVRKQQVKTRAAAEAAKLREALLSSISHDFRSPLAAIIGSSTSLLEYGDRFDESVRRDLLLNIHHEGEKLNQFVTNLLNLTRLHSGVVQPVTRTVALADVIRSSIERLERHGVEPLNIRVEGNCEAQADPLLLEQAIYNILDNAVKYGGPQVEVVCCSSGSSSRVTIADRGLGLPEEDRENIFTSFYFLRTTGRAKGTGLGLSITKGFVEAMGGSVEARNRSDGVSGLEISIELPRP